MGCGSATSRAHDIRSGPKPVLGYWDIQGRGDPIRMLLHHLNVEFEEKRYEFEETSGPKSWSDNKNTLGMLFPNLPYWKDDDIIHSETVPILRSICRKYYPQYMGRNEKEQALADTYTATIYGWFGRWFNPYMLKPDYVQRMDKGLELAKGFRDLIELCIGNKSFMAGNQVTYCDFIAYWILKVLKLYEPTILNRKPGIQKYMDSILSLKGVGVAVTCQRNLLPFSPTWSWWKDRMPETKAEDTSEPNTQDPMIVDTSGKPILGYWNVRARGDPCRMLLYNLGIDFEDKQYVFGDKTPRQSWDFRKSRLGMTFPNLPYFKDGEIIHSETIPILRSICRKYAPKYLGLNEKSQAAADCFTNTIYESFNVWFGAYMFAEDYASKRVEAREQGLEFLELIEKCIAYKRFISSNNITYADFVTYGVLKTLRLYDESMVRAFPKIMQYMEIFEAEPGIKTAERAQEQLQHFLPICAWQKDRLTQSAQASSPASVLDFKPTLGYWNIQGRADPIRMLLHNLGIDFDDKHYVIDDVDPEKRWVDQKDKLNMPFPNLPYWKDGDVIHSETVPILRSICRKYCPDYMGRDDKEQAYADTFTNTIYGSFDLWFGQYMYAPNYLHHLAEGQEQALEYLQVIEDCLGKKRFVAGEEITYADFVTYWILKMLKMYDKVMLTAFPKIMQYAVRFEAQKGIRTARKVQENLLYFSPMAAWQKDLMNKRTN